MPGQIDVERRNSHLLRILGHDTKENVIFFDETRHGLHHSRRMEPVDIVHLLHKGALADDGTDQVQGKRGMAIPIMGHHSSHGDPLLVVKGTLNEGALCFAEYVFVTEAFLELDTQIGYTIAHLQSGVGEFQQVIAQDLDQFVREMDPIDSRILRYAASTFWDSIQIEKGARHRQIPF